MDVSQIIRIATTTKGKKERQWDRLVYLTSGLAELEGVAGLYPRKERIFFECGLAALIRDCHFSLPRFWVHKPVTGQNSRSPDTTVVAIVSTDVTFKERNFDSDYFEDWRQRWIDDNFVSF